MYKVGKTERRVVYIIIIIAIFLLAFYFYSIPRIESKILFTHNGVSLTEKDYKGLQETFPNYITRVCNIESKNCILLYNLPD